MILLWVIIPTAMLSPSYLCNNKFNVDEEIMMSHHSYRPMDEYHLNKEQGIDDVLYQGDIAMTSEQLKDHLSWGRSKRIAPHKRIKPESIWNISRPIPYYFDSNLPEESRQRARQAMSFWSDHTCLFFQEDHVSTPRIRFFYGSGCWSYVGPQNQMIQQDLSLGPGCERHFGIVTHEIAHSLGFYHEHARSDRDQFIELNLNNIDPNNTAQFNKENQKTYNTLGFNYEYGSIMHYSSDLFAVDRNIPVIIAKDNRHQNTMGQRMRPSFRDIYQMNSLYKCHERCKGIKNECLFGGYPSPRNCSLCECPYGFGGDRCEGLEKPTSKNKGCGAILEATEKWTRMEGVVHTGLSDFSYYQPIPESCWWQIRVRRRKWIITTLLS